ncbi:hypothetical protein Cgig2_020797 [Carnegiea gigantea]|uniref:DUF4378 domain-containing protein n=1 Tax=Carnegiea gigantea TaxID=171969 RepID=A0A9Q1KGN3_9CARY|nr:hypothetical protein Cgig2_020797 [Carnegiea gigantea]
MVIKCYYCLFHFDVRLNNDEEESAPKVQADCLRIIGCLKIEFCIEIYAGHWISLELDVNKNVLTRSMKKECCEIDVRNCCVIGAQMNGIQINGKPRHVDKPIQGCLGRMVNLFDLASSKNRLLTNKPHNDGSSLSRSRSDVSRMSTIVRNEVEDDEVSESKWSSLSKTPHGTPVKMLLAQEMSKDLESRQNSPNVVARLMGLDVLPKQQPDLAAQSNSQCYSRNSQVENYWQEEHSFFPKQSDFEVHRNQDESYYPDIYEIWCQSQRKNSIRDKPSQKGSWSENVTEKKLALIRQKFMEAKRLAPDEKLQQTKEFQDALDVLSANGDLFLKVLQEPNSLFSNDLHLVQSIPPIPRTKRITVLRPSKMVVDDKFVAPTRINEKLPQKQLRVNLWDSHNGFPHTMSMWKADDNPSQPTRIVVLKPSLAKVNDVKAVISSAPSSLRIQQTECSCLEPEEEAALEAKEVAKEITQQMLENLAGHRRDETLLSSVFSNGYTGDESSSDKSENEYATGNLSDSEVMSPTSRHSWDYVNRYGSPYSVSSFSRASYSPESSVSREAKRRLSERWAMIASSGPKQEQRNIQKGSSTLGEMLALSEICELDDNTDQDPSGLSSCLHGNMSAGGSGDISPRNLLRSKSLPVSSTVYGERLNDPALCKEDALKDITKTKAAKNSFTGKVTSFFFSRNKKPKKDRSSKPQPNVESQLARADTSGPLSLVGRTSNDQSEVILSSTSELHGGNDGGLCVSQSTIPGMQGENQEQPSPISVLDPPFEEDDTAMLGCSRSPQQNTYGICLHVYPVSLYALLFSRVTLTNFSLFPKAGKQMRLFLSKSNLIDKSPPIGSIARTLSWDECCAETASSYPLSSPFVSPGTEDEEGEWRSLVQSLLTMAGLNDKGQLSTNINKWHSLESPLDPSLKARYIDQTDKEPLHEAKRRRLRCTRKLVFDCANAVLMDMTDVRTTACQLARPHSGFVESGLVDKVWDRAKEWVLGNVKCPPEDGGDIGSLVEWEVWKEVWGKGWADQIRVEVDNIGKEIERKLLQELVEESLLEWIVRD